MAELVQVAVESSGGVGGSLLRAVCKEAQKALQLMLTKIESMVAALPTSGSNTSTGSGLNNGSSSSGGVLSVEELTKLVTGGLPQSKAGPHGDHPSFARTSQQDNNAQLYVCLCLFVSLSLCLFVSVSLCLCVLVSQSLPRPSH